MTCFFCDGNIYGVAKTCRGQWSRVAQFRFRRFCVFLRQELDSLECTGFDRGIELIGCVTFLGHASATAASSLQNLTRAGHRESDSGIHFE
jgi:hypothetical protein